MRSTRDRRSARASSPSWSGAIGIEAGDIAPQVYFRLTDNWLELTVRFLVPDHGIREIKDAMSRDILAALDEAGIGIASSTFEITGLPKLRVEGMPG